MEAKQEVKMNILYIANLLPYPLDGGGKIFTYSTIQALSKENDIDLLCFYEHEDINAGRAELLKYCRSVELLPIRVTTQENKGYLMVKAAKSLFSKKPLSVSKYSSHQMKELIAEKLKTTKYDCVLMNLLAMYIYRDQIKRCDPYMKIVLYEQNCEALIYRRLLSQINNPLKKMFVALETKKLTSFENKAIHEADRLILLSKEDKDALGLKDECFIIPIGVNPPEVQKEYSEKKDHKVSLLFIGTMTWAPNNDGIIWFLQNVMPLCRNHDKYELYIIGKNPSETVVRLCKNYKNVHLMGYVESIEEYYEKCDVLVVPLFIGGGQRVKIIEALGRGFAVISTSVGAEGLEYIDDETIMIANDADAFKKRIDSCDSIDKLIKIGQGGKMIFDKEYSTEIIAKRINNAICQMSDSE